MAMARRIWAALAAFLLLMLWGGMQEFKSLYDAVDLPFLRNATTGPVSEAMSVLVDPYGYPLEEHLVVTKDGYKLRLYRMTGPGGTEAGAARGAPGRAGSAQQQTSSPAPPGSRGVVYLQHPLMDSSAGYVFMGPRHSLGFALADAGWDVWMGNVRGNRFSREHASLSPETNASSYWSFSWQEHAALDLPAMLEHIANVTGVQRFPYIGYSQGTTMALASLSSEAAVQARVSAAVLMAPVAYMRHMSSPLFKIFSYMRPDKLLYALGIFEYAGYRRARAEAASRFCAVAPGLCVRYLFLLCGTNPRENLDRSRLPLMMQYYPAGTSTKNMAHWGQAVRRASPASLLRYDYGLSCTNEEGQAQQCNQQVYGQDSPPPYNMSAIPQDLPMALFSGGQDSLSTPQDVQQLVGVLGPARVRLHHVEPDYAHLDFGLGVDAAQRIWPRIVTFLDQYAPQPPPPSAVGSPAQDAATAAATATADETPAAAGRGAGSGATASGTSYA